MKVVGVAVGLAAATFAMIVLTPLASAHARYKSSTPNAGEVLTTSPATVTIIFTQEVQKVSGTYGIDVVDESGASVIDGPATLDDTDRTKMSVPLKPNLPRGRYEVNWKDVSDADGDPFAGSWAFYVGVQPTSAEQATDQAELGAGSSGTPAANGIGTPAISGTSLATLGAPTAVATSSSVSSSTTGLFIVIGVVGALIVAGGGAWLYVRSRRM